MFKKRTRLRYGNKQTQYSGYSFASKLEAAVYQILKLREKAGELVVLQTQAHVYLSEARIGYVPDFMCKNLKTGEVFYVEAKGFANDRWPILKKLWAAYGPGTLEIWMGNYTHPQLAETIVPKESVK